MIQMVEHIRHHHGHHSYTSLCQAQLDWKRVVLLMIWISILIHQEMCLISAFKTVNKQDITLRIRNIVGEEIYTEELNQFDGTYTKAISLENYPKAVYFIEIYTSQGTVNKK